MPGTEVRSPLDIVRKLVPQIRACAAEIEATRELPRPLFEALADAGLFHLALPRALGCPELDLPTYELGLLPEGVDLAGLYGLARELRKQGPI